MLYLKFILPHKCGDSVFLKFFYILEISFTKISFEFNINLKIALLNFLLLFFQIFVELEPTFQVMTRKRSSSKENTVKAL